MCVFEQVNLYILVAGLEALCVCSATKSSNGVIYRFSQESQYCTGYPQIGHSGISAKPSQESQYCTGYPQIQVQIESE